MNISSNLTIQVLDPKTTRRKYPEPRISEKKSWLLAYQVDSEGSAEVWRGLFEQAELYHKQLVCEGLTMAPIEKI